MKNRLVSKGKKNQRVSRMDILKARALGNFEKALLEERYEECGELIGRARERGARQSEVRRVIAGAVRGLKGGTQREAVFKGVRRF